MGQEEESLCFYKQQRTRRNSSRLCSYRVSVERMLGLAVAWWHAAFASLLDAPAIMIQPEGGRNGAATTKLCYSPPLKTAGRLPRLRRR